MSNNARIAVGVIIVLLIAGIIYASNKNDNAPTTAGTSQKQTIKLGWMGPLTGDAASYGESIQKGVQLAQKDAGLSNVDIIFEDSKCDAKPAADAVNKLVKVDKVAAIIGEVCSSATLAAAPVAQGAKVVLVSPSSTSPKITEAGDYIFRVIPSDALQGKFGAELVYKNGQRKLAILYGNEDYGIGFKDVLTQSFSTLGAQVVASEAVEKESTDARTQLTKIKAANPDAVYIISNSPSTAAAALKQLKELGITAAVYGSEGLKSPDVTKGAGNAAEGLILSSVSSGTADFTAKYKAAYNADPGPFAAQAYDAYMALAKAIAGGAISGEQIKDALIKVDFPGVSGHIKFDANGDVSGNYEVYVVKNGQFVSSNQ